MQQVDDRDIAQVPGRLCILASRPARAANANTMLGSAVPCLRWCCGSRVRCCFRPLQGVRNIQIKIGKPEGESCELASWEAFVEQFIDSASRGPENSPRGAHPLPDFCRARRLVELPVVRLLRAGPPQQQPADDLAIRVSDNWGMALRRRAQRLENAGQGDAGVLLKHDQHLVACAPVSAFGILGEIPQGLLQGNPSGRGCSSRWRKRGIIATELARISCRARG